MRAAIRGVVRAVEVDEYRPDNPKIKLYVSEDPKFGPDIVEGTVDLLGKIDHNDRVEILCNVQARKSKAGNAYLSIWAVEVLDLVPAAVVDPVQASNGKAKAAATA
jgi:hypothetical protein